MRIMIIDDDINKTETIKNAISNIFSSIPSSNEKLEIDENIFGYIKNSLEYKHCKGDRICNLEIYLDET